MEKFKLHVYPAANRDLLEVVDYVNEMSPEAAKRTYDTIIDKIGSLSRMPQRCMLLKNPTLRIKGYRVIKADRYLVFYVVTGKTVEIRRILHERREYETIL